MKPVTRRMLALAGMLAWLSGATPAWADQRPEAEAIWHATLAQQGKLAFAGLRESRLWRGFQPLDTRTTVAYVDAGNYAVAIETGQTREPLRFTVVEGRTYASFPDDGLYFAKGAPETALIPGQLLLEHLPAWPQRSQPVGYALRRLPDAIVALTPCYVLEFSPLGGPGRPRIRFKIAKDSKQILASQRSRDLQAAPEDVRPYFESHYRLFRTGQAGVSAPAPGPGGVKVDLEQSFNGAFRTYATAAEAAATENIEIYQPHYVPAEFTLQQVQVLRVFGVPIQLLSYSDGLNLLMLASQPEIDPLRILFSGLVNLNYYAITRRMVSLKAYAPYDYFSRFTPKTQSIVFGDLDSAELRRISQSYPVP